MLWYISLPFWNPSQTCTPRHQWRTVWYAGWRSAYLCPSGWIGACQRWGSGWSAGSLCDRRLSGCVAPGVHHGHRFCHRPCWRWGTSVCSSDSPPPLAPLLQWCLLARSKQALLKYHRCPFQTMERLETDKETDQHDCISCVQKIRQEKLDWQIKSFKETSSTQ